MSDQGENQVAQWQDMAADALARARERAEQRPGQWGEMLGQLAIGRNLSRQAVYNYEAGKVRVPADILLAAARLSGADLHELLPQLSDPNSRLRTLERELTQLRGEVAILQQRLARLARPGRTLKR